MVRADSGDGRESTRALAGTSGSGWSSKEESAVKRNETRSGGANVFGGIVLNEYNPDLKGRLELQIAEKMRRNPGYGSFACRQQERARFARNTIS
jgi:hypothetical protein